MHEDCVFCSPKEKAMKENALAQAFLSNPRKVPGHFVVVPKRHVEKPWELTNDELTSIFELIFFIEQKIIGRLGEGADIKQNYRPFMPEGRIKKDHLLFHVYPRSLHDYLYKTVESHETDLYTDLDDLERAEVSKLLQ